MSEKFASDSGRLTRGGLLPSPQGTRLAVAATRTSPGTFREGLLDEVGEDDGGTVVREAFDEFDERNC